MDMETREGLPRQVFHRFIVVGQSQPHHDRYRDKNCDTVVIVNNFDRDEGGGLQVVN